MTACKASCSAILEVCYKAKDWKQLEEQVVLLAKRRGQLKQVRHSTSACATQLVVYRRLPYISTLAEHKGEVHNRDAIALAAQSAAGSLTLSLISSNSDDPSGSADACLHHRLSKPL